MLREVVYSLPATAHQLLDTPSRTVIDLAPQMAACQLTDTAAECS